MSEQKATLETKQKKTLSLLGYVSRKQENNNNATKAEVKPSLVKKKTPVKQTQKKNKNIQKRMKNGEKHAKNLTIILTI